VRQLSLYFKQWGGARRGAGRKPKLARAGVAHLRRPAHEWRHPLHVTIRVREGLPSLRSQSLFGCVRRQIAVAKRRLLRIVHYSVQSNHIHLLIEAADRGRLGAGMKGFGVRVAKNVNRMLSARGHIWADRYHARPLRTPREVRNALVYVLFNRAKHGGGAAPDRCSSVIFFDGWSDAPAARERTALARMPIRGSPDKLPVVRPRTWLLSSGWKRLGLLPRNAQPNMHPHGVRRSTRVR
jgi:putative transposase